jgi:putative transposase
MPWNKPYEPSRNQRLDPDLYCQRHQVCFITVRAYQDQLVFTRRDLADLVIAVLREQAAQSACTVFTYCLMPDHMHFLAAPQQDGASVLRFADQFKGKSTNRSWQVGWRGRLWQPRYYDHIVRREESLFKIVEYILHNPVRKGLVARPEDWPWSGQIDPFPL